MKSIFLLVKPFVILAGIGAGWWSGFTFRSDAEKVLMTACFLACVVDWLTGLVASWKIGKPITSNRMRKGIGKIIGYFGLIIIAISTAQFLQNTGSEVPKLPILTAALGLIFATEALSVLENITKLTGLKIPFLLRALEGARPDPIGEAIEASHETRRNH